MLRPARGIRRVSVALTLTPRRRCRRGVEVLTARRPASTGTRRSLLAGTRLPRHRLSVRGQRRPHGRVDHQPRDGDPDEDVYEIREKKDEK